MICPNILNVCTLNLMLSIYFHYTDRTHFHPILSVGYSFAQTSTPTLHWFSSFRECVKVGKIPGLNRQSLQPFDNGRSHWKKWIFETDLKVYFTVEQMLAEENIILWDKRCEQMISEISNIVVRANDCGYLFAIRRLMKAYRKRNFQLYLTTTNTLLIGQ